MNQSLCEAEVRHDGMYSGIRCSRTAAQERIIRVRAGDRKARLCGQHARLLDQGGTVYLVKLAAR